MGEPGIIRLTQHIGFPPDQVWAALTDPALVERWWAKGDIRPVVGHRFTLDMGAFGQQSCRVLSVRPNKEFSYSFGEGMLDTTITWTLEGEAGGTVLTLTHAGFDLASPMGGQAYQGMSGGWPQLLPRIEAVLTEQVAPNASE